MMNARATTFFSESEQHKKIITRKMQLQK